MSTPQYSSINLNPQLRIQVLLENEAGAPTKEFKAGVMLEPTFDALVAHIFGMTSFDHDSLDQYNVTFKYNIEEKHESRWINFDSTEGLGYAIQSNQEKGYVYISASIVKKEAIAPVMVAPSPGVLSRNETIKPKVVKKSNQSKPKKPKNSTGTKMNVEEKILAALKELLALGIAKPPRKQVALFSGYSNVQSKGFANAVSKLSKTHGYVEYPDSKTISLTQKGIEKAGMVSPATSNEQVQGRIKQLLQPKAIEIFDALADGSSHVRDDVAAQVGYTNVQSKGFSNALSKMSSLDILEYPKDEMYPKKKMVRLTDIAFPLGRPGESRDVSANEAPATDDSGNTVSAEMKNSTTATVTSNGADAFV